MSEHYKFFAHRECEYFPCHETKKPQEFNCLFCYCPLYMLGDRCGGNYHYTKEGYKDCSGCMLPHSKNGYAYIVEKYGEIAEKVRAQRKEDTAGRLSENVPQDAER